jgi:hypothetical protein
MNLKRLKDTKEIEVKGYDEICEAIERELMNVNDLKFKVTGDEDLAGIEGDIEEFIDTLLADTGDTAKVTVVVDAPLVEVHWLIN